MGAVIQERRKGLHAFRKALPSLRLQESRDCRGQRRATDEGLLVLLQFRQGVRFAG